MAQQRITLTLARQRESSSGSTLETRWADVISSLASSTIDTARAVAREAFMGYWRTMTTVRGSSIAILPCDLELPSLAKGTAGKAQAFGAGLALLPVSMAIEAVGRLYTHALPMEHRSSHGIFYTPPLLVRRLLDSATAEKVNWQTARVISPSCGGGAFLVEDADRMRAAMGVADPAIIVTSVGARLVGWDRDSFACWLSQVAVETVLLDQVIASGRRLPRIIECRDSLMDDWSGHLGKYELVNDNPAFGKVKKSDALTTRFSRSQRGHMNTYGLFIDLAIHLAREKGGVIMARQSG